MTSLSKLRTALHDARARMDAIFNLIKPNSWYERPIPERHRLIFYLGHLEAFDWNQVCRWTLEKPSFHPEFDQLFEAGIDPKQGELPQDTPSDWPSIEEVKRYNARIRNEVDRALEEVPAPILHVAIEHRWMHVETTGYLLHHLPLSKKLIPDLPPLIQCPSPQPEMIEIPPGTATLGRRQEDGFGWDNEFGKHEIDVPPFAISKYKVTNGQYLRFVEDGAAPPPFWGRSENQWVLKTMFEEILLPKDWPVYVSQREAQAYAAWAGKRLLTEAEWERAARGLNGRRYPWGNEFAASHCNCLEAGLGGTSPVGHFSLEGGDTPEGLVDMVGNVWEWTNTLYRPYPYQADDGRESRQAAGFRVLRGASFKNDANVAHALSRLDGDFKFFNNVGFRCAVSPE